MKICDILNFRFIHLCCTAGNTGKALNLANLSKFAKLNVPMIIFMLTTPIKKQECVASFLYLTY